MEFYKVQSIEEITNELILSLIERYKTKEVPRLKRLYNYYLGKSDTIKNRTMNDSSKPNNKVANPLGALIVNSIQGYFLGKPVSYSTDKEQEDYMLKVQEIFDKNHEQSHNAKIGKQLSITGICYELVYMNEMNEVRFNMLNPEEVFMIYDNSIEMKPLCAIRFYDVQNYLEDTVETHVEMYTSNVIEFFKVDDGELVTVDEQPHYFQEIPVNVYHNNDENTGAFEKVIDLIDCYDRAISDTSNDLETFADAYLVISGIDMNEEDVNTMRERRVMLTNENGKVEWLTKSQQNMEIEAFKTRLREDIHNLSSVPNFNDQTFGSATSGEALKYRLFGLETVVSTLERLFEQSLERRIKLITNILNIMGGNYEHTDIVMAFQRNLPTNYAQITDMIQKLQGIVSNDTLLTLLPFVDDPAYEKELLADQNEGTLYPNFVVEDEITTTTNVDDPTVI